MTRPGKQNNAYSLLDEKGQQADTWVCGVTLELRGLTGYYSDDHESPPWPDGHIQGGTDV
jgi:hypothetical protein